MVMSSNEIRLAAPDNNVHSPGSCHAPEMSSNCSCNTCLYEAGRTYIPRGTIVEDGCQNCAVVDGKYVCTCGCWI